MCSDGTHSDYSDPQVQGKLKELKVMGFGGEGKGRCGGTGKGVVRVEIDGRGRSVQGA